MIARRTAAPPALDGRLDDPAWSQTPAYALHRPGPSDAPPSEGGEVRLLWDERRLYVGARLVDSDVVQTCLEDHQHHYRTGDVLELFLKPENPRNATCYWECYVTPAGNRTAFFFATRGAPIEVQCDTGLTVAAAVQGTLNDRSDRDRGWSAVMAVPIADLTSRGAAFGPGAAWRILVG